MEKRRRRKTQTVAQFLRRYFLITALGVLALLAAAFCLFQLGLNAGWYTPANHAEIQAQELIGKIQMQDFFDPNQVPDGLDYILFSHEQWADSSLPPDNTLADYSYYSGSYTGMIGASAWLRTDLRAETVILLFRYAVRPASPAIAALIPDLQGGVCRLLRSDDPDLIDRHDQSLWKEISAGTQRLGGIRNPNRRRQSGF